MWGLTVLASFHCITNWFLETTSSSYASLLHQQDAHVTRVGLPRWQYCTLFRTPNLGACFVHTQNSRWCLAIKICHGDPHSSFAISNWPSNRFKRSYWALPGAFIGSHRSGSSSVITGGYDSRIIYKSVSGSVPVFECVSMSVCLRVCPNHPLPNIIYFLFAKPLMW